MTILLLPKEIHQFGRITKMSEKVHRVEWTKKSHNKDKKTSVCVGLTVCFFFIVPLVHLFLLHVHGNVPIFNKAKLTCSNVKPHI